MKGIILYEGISQIDNKTPIVCIATLNSSNVKTGNMISTWILRQDIDPHQAVKLGMDAAVCGDCKYSNGNGCYVLTWQAPSQVWKSYKKGNYPHFNNSHTKHFKGRNIRCGAYGDPSAVPYIVWHNILKQSKSHTGYTHQWHNLSDQWKFLMASVDNTIEHNLASSLGWRSFRVVTDQSEDLSGSVMCPATMVDSDVTCTSCKLCKGNRTKAKDIYVEVHGAKNTIKKATLAVAQN